MNKIIVKELFSNGLSEKNGILIREKIKPILEKDEIVELDFSDILLFATPFFNSFIGYFVYELGPEIVRKSILITNISELGNKTYEHSFENAAEKYEKKVSEEMLNELGNVVESNISED